MFHCIFDYNYGNFCYILIIFPPLEIGMNILPNMYKLFLYSLIMPPIYLMKLKITPNRPTAYAVHSVEPIVPDFRRKSFNVRFFPAS